MKHLCEWVQGRRSQKKPGVWETPLLGIEGMASPGAPPPAMQRVTFHQKVRSRFVRFREKVKVEKRGN